MRTYPAPATPWPRLPATPAGAGVTRIGYMLRPAESHHLTPAEEQYCRDLAHQIFGTGTDRADTAFCETHAPWWLVLCIVVPSLRDSITDMLEVWDLRPRGPA